MKNINWNIFNVKNPRCEDAFEEMCLHIFCREHKIDAHNFKANFNQTGLEIEPYDLDGKHYGFQSKYITGNGESLYSQVYKSLSKAVEIYKDRLDVIFIYTNLNIKPNITNGELNKYKEERDNGSRKKKINRMEIKLLERDFDVEIKFITESNFKVILAQPENEDLYRMFFSSENEKGFLENILSITDRTFLRSSQFVNLPMNGNDFYSVQKDILDNNSLIVGHAGTGKTELMKSLFLYCEEQFLQTTDNSAPIPVFIRLRECINGNLEDLIRQRLRDYHLNVDSNRNYIYFLDGVDEVYASFTSVFISQVKRLEEQPLTQRIILSSRPSSVNLSSLYNVINPIKYQIDPLGKEYIKMYFKLQNSDYKIIEPFAISNTIDDILSITLLHQNVNLLDEHTTRIDLIKHNIVAMLSNNSELQKLNIPAPYIEAISNILKRVAIIMHRTKTITITLNKMQDIIHTLYSQLSYKDIDAVISYVSGLFFDHSTDKNESIIYSFRHKRYFEYFLYLYVSEKFYESPFVLREENLLINKDFIINIFLTQEIKKYTIAQDMAKVLSLRFLEVYLGENYIAGYKNEWVGQGRINFSGASDYLMSGAFLSYLCQKDKYEFETYLKMNLDMLSSFLTKENYWDFVHIYHKRNHIDIREVLCNVFEYKGEDIKETQTNIGDILYYILVVRKEDFNIEEIYVKHIKGIDATDLEKKLEQNEKLLKNELNEIVSFFDIALRYYDTWLISKVSELSLEELEALCYCILQKRNLKMLLNNNELVEAILTRIESNSDDKFYLYSKVIYMIKKGSDRYLLDIQQRLSAVNINHYDTWRTGIDLNNFCAVLADENLQLASMEYRLGISLTKIILENPKSGDGILDKIIDEVRKYNFISTNFFAYENAVYIGHIICSYSFEFNDIKKFLKDLGKYEDVVSSFNVLYTIFECDVKLFKIVANKKYLSMAYDYNIKQLTYYDWLSDTNFRYATMLSVFDKIEAENICLKGIGNSLLRPIFRKEDLIKYTLPQCVEIAAINQWFASDELEHMCYRIFHMLQIVKETLDSGFRLDILREVVHKYLPYSELNEKLYEYESDNGDYSRTKEVRVYNDFDIALVNETNLKDYYECKVKNIQYDDYIFWKKLIDFEYSFDPELEILYEILNKNYFPSSHWNEISRFYKYIVAVLLSRFETRQKIINAMMSSTNRDAIPLMINVFSLTGDEDEGKLLTEIFISLCETLVCIEEPNSKSLQVGSYRYRIMQEIYSSNYLDWIIDEENRKLVNVKNTEISIYWEDEDDKFNEEWATSHPDCNAYRRDYSILLKGVLIDKVSLVYVDGYRSLIPMPKINTNVVSRNDYKFARIVNQEAKSVNEYILCSGLVID